jgi:hypothetical protein
MIVSTSSRILRVALFILVPVAYLSMVLWQPASAYTKHGRAGVNPFCAVLMLLVFLVCSLSWSQHRVVAAFGFIACFLWLVITLLPVL